MPKQTKKHLKTFMTRTRAVFLIVLAIGVAGSSAIAVHADQYDEQIQALQAQNNDAQNIVNGLASQASSYQDAITQLQSQINSLQAALNSNKAQQESVGQQITAAQEKIDLEKQYLSESIRTMYTDGSLSTIEELATSKNLSDYVDKQEYRTRVQNKIDASIKEIAVLQAQLKEQKAQLDALVASQQQQNDQLAAAQSQQQQMLAYNEGQQAAFNQQISANSSKIGELRAQQLAANRRLNSTGSIISSGSCGGGYPASATGGNPGPWGCNYEHSSDYEPGCTYLDSFSMCNRECVSYTAWMVYKTYGISTAGYGNARDWPSNTRYPTGSTPKVGSVAISTSSYYGHAMWVVGVSGNQIHVYSYNDYYDGNFYDHWVSASGLTFIYFDQ